VLKSIEIICCAPAQFRTSIPQSCVLNVLIH